MGKRETLPVPTMEVWHYLMSFAWGWFSIKTYQDIVVLAFSLLTQVITLNVNKNPHDSDPCVTVPMKIVLCNVVRLTNKAVWQVSTLAQLSQQPEIPPSYQRSLPTTSHQRVKSQFCHRTCFHKTSKHDEIHKYINHDQVHVQWWVLVGFDSNHVRSTRRNMARRCNGTCKKGSDLSKLLQFLSTNHWQSKDSLHGNQVLNGVSISQQRSIWQVNRKTLISYPNTWLPMGPGQSCFCSRVQFMRLQSVSQLSHCTAFATLTAAANPK